MADRPKKLAPPDVESRLEQIPGWSVRNDRLERTFTFGNFIEAFGFMTQVALAAEKRDHHPEWSNVYKTVEIGLRTHDCDGISERDFALALAIDAIAGEFTG